MIKEKLFDDLKYKYRIGEQYLRNINDLSINALRNTFQQHLGVAQYDFDDSTRYKG